MLQHWANEDTACEQDINSDTLKISDYDLKCNPSFPTINYRYSTSIFFQ